MGGPAVVHSVSSHRARRCLLLAVLVAILIAAACAGWTAPPARSWLQLLPCSPGLPADASVQQRGLVPSLLARGSPPLTLFAASVTAASTSTRGVCARQAQRSYISKDGCVCPLEASMAGPAAACSVIAVPPEWQRIAGLDPATGSVKPGAAIDWEFSTAGGEARRPHFRYCSLDQLFPEAPGLAQLFNSDAAFRHQLRAAARSDLSAQEQAPRVLPPIASSMGDDETLQTFAGEFVGEGRLRLRPMPRLDAVMEGGGFQLTGRGFMARLFGLCDGICCGSWTDIVGAPRRGQRWHQDEGLDTLTVMLGFPPADNFVGEGVFSQVALISHRLAPIGLGIPIEVGWAIPEEAIFRPVYAPGQEVVVYSDCALLHRAPDLPNREAVWRLL